MLVKTAVLTFSTFLFLCHNVYGRPAVDSGSDPLGVCYSLKCPDDTTMCGKHSEISESDKTKLSVQIRCYDAEGNILKSKNITEENPFGTNVYYKGHTFSAVIRLSPSYTSNKGSDSDDEKEYNFIPKTGPKSEVEDLESK